MEFGDEVTVQKRGTLGIASDYRKRLVWFTHLIEYDAGASKIMVPGVIVDSDDGL